MILMQGKGVSRGVVRGPVVFFRRQDNDIAFRPTKDLEGERKRLIEAQRRAVAQLESLAEKCRAETGDESAVLFETHAMFVEDEDYAACIRDILETRQCSAEYAVQQAGKRFAAMFAAMDDPYMRGRAADVQDVSRRIMDNLMGNGESSIHFAGPVILAAEDLVPSETIRLDKEKILGFITQQGSTGSHTAILARAMGIPAVCALGESLKEEYNGRFAYMDGETGRVVLEPDERTLASLDKKHREQQKEKEILKSMKGQEDVTLDGRRIHVYCNIGSPEDIAAVQANDGQGIGLFRSEFLYLAAGDFPTEEEQFQAYKRVATAMKGKRVIIRTLDIGADKQANYFGLQKEENPALGMRAIRICLNRPDIFKVQLRAMYRASAYGRVAIMFPMIASLWEVQECKRICGEVMADLDREGVPYADDVEIGIMIETPASVFIAKELAEEVDFFSVGTNDLTQYTLACDRQVGDLSRFLDPHHPAVLRGLKVVVDAAHEAGIWVGICGELGADLDMLDTFLALGIDEISVSPAFVLPLRAKIRASIAKNCTLDKLKCR